MNQGSQVPAADVRESLPAAPDQTKWTVMVFMGADNVEGTASLKSFAKSDLDEMAQVGSDGPLSIFVQVYGLDGGPKRGKIAAGSELEPVPREQADAKGGLALQHFIGSSLGASGHDPLNPQHYTMLVLWGHAFDFAIGRQKRVDGTIDALDFGELSDVLHRLQQQDGTSDAKLHILGFDACDAATVELACQLEPFAH